MPISAGVVLTWFFVSQTDSKNAGFFCFLFYFVYYAVFSSGSLRSQFFPHRTVFQPEFNRISPFYFEKALSTLFLWILPTMVHISIFHKVLFSSGSNILRLIFVFCLPGVALKLVSHTHPYEWTNNRDSKTSNGSAENKITDRIFLLSMIGLIPFLGNQVISSFITTLIPLFAPWSYIFMAAMLYSLFCLVFLHLIYGLWDTQLSQKIFLGLIITAAISLGANIGLSLWLYPVIITSAISLYLVYWFDYGEVIFLFCSSTSDPLSTIIDLPLCINNC